MREKGFDLFKIGEKRNLQIPLENKDSNEGGSRHEKMVIERAEITFRIIAKSVKEYHFIIPYDLVESDRVEVGQIFSIRDSNTTFLSRVLDIRYDSNYDGNWDTTLKGTQFFDSDQIFNRIIAEPLGCIEGGKFKKSRTIPTKFSPVARADKDEFKFLKQVMGDIEIGHLRNGSRLVEEIAVALHSDAMDHHMGVFATTGMGKSNFMKVFAASCMRLSARNESKFGLLIVDPHGEYLMGNNWNKGLVHLKRYADSLICYSTDKKNSQMPRVEELCIGTREIQPSDIGVLYEWTAAQWDALEAISRVLGENWIEEIQTPQGIAEMVSSGFNENTIGVISRRIKNILGRNRYIDPFRSSVPGIIAHLQAGKVVLLDIPRVSDRSELFLLSILSRYILETYKEQSSEERKNCLITIEEAQRVLGEGNLIRFETIAREGRKFGVGLCAITQQPKLIDKHLLSQFNTLVIMGLGDRNDRIQLEESAKQDLSSLDIEIQTLEKGEAIISTLNIPFPVPAKIYRYEDYIKILDKEDLAEEISISSGSGFRPVLDISPRSRKMNP